MADLQRNKSVLEPRRAGGRDDDHLLDLDEPVSRTIESWRKDPRKARVTIRQLLDFSAGLAPGFGLQQNDYGDRDRAALRLPLVRSRATRSSTGRARSKFFTKC